VILNINENEEVNLDMSENEYFGYLPKEAICDETYEIEMIATNSNEQTVEVITSITTSPSS